MHTSSQAAHVSLANLLAAACLPRSTLYRVLHTADEPHPDTLRALDEGMQLLDRDNLDGISGWRELPNDWLAPRLDVSEQDVNAGKRGKRQWRTEERARLQTAMTAWRAEHHRTYINFFDACRKPWARRQRAWRREYATGSLLPKLILHWWQRPAGEERMMSDGPHEISP